MAKSRRHPTDHQKDIPFDAGLMTLNFRLTPLLFLINVVAVWMVVHVLVQIFRTPLTFDDAFMFERYAIHLREGMGISWNPDGIPTAGMTSMGWFLLVYPLSFLPWGEGHPLAAGSFATGLAGIAWLAFQTSKLAASPLLRRFWLLLPALTLVLLGNRLFRSNMVTGMDTMLSFFLNAALSCSLWAWCNVTGGNARGGEGTRRAILVGFLAASTIIVRPENGLLAILGPILAAFLLRDAKPKLEAFQPALTCAAIMGIYLILYHAYFHTWLPLSFYVKSRHPYLGYTGAIRWQPELYLHDFLLLALPILAFPLACLDARSLRVGLTYLVPLTLTFAYLETVTQIMGWDSRYYIPFLAPVLVAAFWMTDLALQKDWQHLLRQRRGKLAVSFPLLLLLAIGIWRPIRKWSEHRLIVAPYPAATLVTPAPQPLPQRPWFATISVLANQVVKPLPPGTVVAASEVGLIGAAAPQVGVIDLAGLNDKDIATNGFSMDRLLDRQPALIWFPHSEYTWQRRAMLCSPRLLQAYTVLGGNAFNYSLAVRREAPEAPQLTQSVSQAFQHLYPGVAIKDYIVSSITCN